MNNSEIRKICLGKFEEAEDLFLEKIYPNIETCRKGDCKIKCLDKNGNPLIGRSVKITQKKHDFKYGANIFMLDEFASEEDNKAYREEFAKYFNLATIPFYWKGLEPEKGKPRYDADSPKVYRRPAPDLCLEYCREKGIDGKLHCLFYDKFLPDWMPRNDEKEMLLLYEKRFAGIAKRYSGKLYEVEVLNELLSEWWWTGQSVLSERRDILELMFSLAEQYFQNDTLVINDGNYIPEIGQMDYRHPYYMLIDAALSKGVRIDKIGVQNHIYCGCVKSQEEEIHSCEPFFDPMLILKGFEVLSSFDKPLEITEVTIPTVGEGEEAEEIQAQLLRYLYTIWFSIPQMESIVYWNTVDGTALDAPGWMENNCRGGLLHTDFSPKKSAVMLKKLFSEIWHTELELVTDEDGYINFRGFYGDYSATSAGEEISFGIHKNTSNSYEMVW